MTKLFALFFIQQSPLHSGYINYTCLSPSLNIKSTYSSNLQQVPALWTNEIWQLGEICNNILEVNLKNIITNFNKLSDLIGPLIYKFTQNNHATPHIFYFFKLLISSLKMVKNFKKKLFVFSEPAIPMPNVQ